MPSAHKRNIAGMQASPRCGARTRRGTACQAPAVAGKQRCRMHGGTAGNGAPHGYQNALKHGLYTRESKELLAHIRELSRQTKDLIEKI